MTKSKLGRKIRILMMVLTLTACVAMFMVAYIDIAALKKNSMKMNEELSRNSSEVVSEGIISQTDTTMMEVTSAKALKHDADFAYLGNQIKNLCESMNYVYANCDYEDYEAAPHPKNTEDGVLMGRSTITKSGKAENDTVMEQIIVSSAENIIAQIYNNSDMMSNIMVGTKSGVFYRYSNYNTYSEEYDLHTRTWFNEAIDNPGEIIWSDAYMDSVGRNVVTVSCAYFDENGECAGVVASDIEIQTLIDTILTKDRIGDGYAFLLDKNGKFIAHPFIGSKEEVTALSPKDPGINDVKKQMLAGETGSATFHTDEGEMLIFFAPVEATGWTYGTVIPYSQITKPAQESSHIIEEVSAKTQQDMNNAINSMLIIFIVILVIVIVILLLASIQIAKYISEPVSIMVDEMAEIGRGNFDSNIKIRGDDELTSLGNSINEMAAELKQYVLKITEVTAERQRIGAELDLATKIQASSLPSIFPAFPDRNEFELFASMHPAKEVGGDFYDFFLVDDDHLGLVIADVSGKGVGAALFMMISKTLINNQAMFTESPAQVLKIVNERLCKNNEAEMFVTVWLGVLQISTGVMKAANAGHEYPAIKRANGEFELFKDRHGLVLGGMEGISFKEYEIQFEKDDILFVYTDGVPEATNANNELFGTERMIKSLNRDANADVNTLLSNVTEDIQEFVQNAPQFDDITMLTMKYKG